LAFYSYIVHLLDLRFPASRLAGGNRLGSYRQRLSFVLGLFLFAFVAVATSFAASAYLMTSAKRVLSEAEAKAAFVLNFARFTQWPVGGLPEDHGTITIAVSTEGRLASELQRLSKGFLVQGHPVEVVVLEDPADNAICQVLFVEKSERLDFQRYLKAKAGKNILVVGDQPESVKWGAAIAFRPEKSRLQFVINRKAARAQGLSFSSQLLKLAANIME
jgi:hypothetical protein